MTSPRTWTVVLFESDNSVQAVPTKWLDGDNCLWPVVPQDKLAKALKNCEYNSHWPGHKVRIFRNSTYNDYAIARAKAAKAEYSSDLNSDDDNLKLGLKRSRKKTIFSSSDSEDEIPISSIKDKKQKSSLPAPPPPPPPKWNDIENSNVQPEDDCGIIDTPVRIKYGENPAKNMNSRKSVDPANVISGISPKENCKCNPQILYNIQSLLTDLNSKVDKLSKNHQSANELEPKESILEKSKMNFPISTEDALKDFEQFLTLDENYISMVSFFSRMGGTNLYDYMKRCLGGILADNIAIKYSFLGRKGKNKFCDLSLSKALLDSAEKSGLPKDRKESELAIGCWLRKAKCRSTREEKK